MSQHCQKFAYQRQESFFIIVDHIKKYRLVHGFSSQLALSENFHSTAGKLSSVLLRCIQLTLVHLF
jgi:hypothetical protein